MSDQSGFLTRIGVRGRLYAAVAVAGVGLCSAAVLRAQDDKNAPPAQPGQPAGLVAQGRPPGGGQSVAASGDFVYVLRGGTLYQLKTADLSIAAQKDLPPPAAGVGAAGAPPSQ